MYIEVQAKFLQFSSIQIRAILLQQRSITILGRIVVVTDGSCSFGKGDFSGILDILLSLGSGRCHNSRIDGMNTKNLTDVETLVKDNLVSSRCLRNSQVTEVTVQVIVVNCSIIQTRNVIPCCTSILACERLIGDKEQFRDGGNNQSIVRSNGGVL